MVDFLDKYALRSYKQILVHLSVIIAIVIASNIFFCGFLPISTDSFVTIASSMSAASGVLLAISLALFFFFARYFIDRRDALIEKLKQLEEKLRVQMQKSVQRYPDIPRKLSALYEKSVRYIPGQPIDLREVEEASSIFEKWASEQAVKHAKQLDAGDPKIYDSFEVHLRDAHVIKTEVKRTFLLLHSVYVWSRAIPTFAPLVLAWVIVVILSLVYALIGGMEIIPNDLGLSFLIIPTYLFLVAIFALIKDILAIAGMTRDLETSYEMAMQEIAIIKDSDIP